MLTYNLVHDVLGLKELAANSDKGMAKLRLLFALWKDSLDKGYVPDALAFLFEHQYTDASLRYDGLKGHDQQVASHFRDVCEQYGYCFYLANLERTVEGDCDEDSDGGYCRGSKGFHEIIEDCGTETTLKRVVELDGTEVAQDLDSMKTFLIQEDPFEGMDPDDEDYSGYTGNEGVSATHFYHKTVYLSSLLLYELH